MGKGSESGSEDQSDRDGCLAAVEEVGDGSSSDG